MPRFLLLAAVALSAPVLAQTAPVDPPTPESAPPNDNRAAILDDAATTPRTGETDVGATRGPDYRPAGVGGSATKAYPPCTRTRTDSCRQRGGR
ncbi:MAG TPA: hypothetical protein VEA61_01460 [Allosphingosinicella sp.]|nr:hypothetical protein [Allosphingosinicella sp.]